jgi:hypothetical protein
MKYKKYLPYVIGIAVIAIVIIALISTNFAYHTDRFETPYGLAVDFLDQLKGNDSKNIDKVYEYNYGDKLESIKLPDNLRIFAINNPITKLKFDFATYKSHVYSIYTDLKGNEISPDQWRELEEKVMDEVMEDLGYKELTNRRMKEGDKASPELLNEYFNLLDKVVYETDKRMPQPKKVFEERVTVRISSDSETLMFVARKTDTGYYLSRDFEPTVFNSIK